MFASLFSRWFSSPAPAEPAAPAPAIPRRAPAADREPGITVLVSRAADGLVIHVRGDGGVRQSGALLAGLLVPAALQAPVVALDLSELSSISCLAMGVLVSFRRSVVRRACRVRLLPGLRPQVREALDRAGLLELFGEGGEAALPQPVALAG
jgi:anti-anti-sigma factor